MEAVPGQMDSASEAAAVTEQPGARSTSAGAAFEAGGIDELEKTSKIIVQQVCLRPCAICVTKYIAFTVQ